MKYRADIDGLRTFAIVPVVAFHAGVQLLSGGFIGVDIFFVISGYLITRIIVEEVYLKKFHITEFYKRRILRILPALSIVLIATIAMAFWLMLPNEFISTGQSVLSSALFVSNIYFWFNSGYFDGASTIKPLLHTWSLSVEEQFYVFFPLLIVLVHRYFKGRFALSIWIMVLASFLLSVVGVEKSASATFYLLPTRVWELGIGSLIAVGGVPKVDNPISRHLLAAVGLLLILFGIFYLTEAMPFPGANALYPCLGAGLIIAYGANTHVGYLLGRAPIVFIGKISYSLYLWHWPVIVFYRLQTGGDLTPTGTIITISASFVLSVLSYYFIESPFRKPVYRDIPASRVLYCGVSVLAAFVAVGVLIDRTGENWRSYPKEIIDIASYTEYRKTTDYETQFRKGMCFISGTDGSEIYDAKKCLTIEPGKKTYIVMGDSHAAHLWRALSMEFPNTNVLQATISGCRPVLNGGGAPACRRAFDDIFKTFIVQNHVDGVILSGRWTGDDMTKLAETISYLSSHVNDVIVVGPTVEYSGEFPILLANKIYNNNPTYTSKSLNHKILNDDNKVRDIISRTGARYVDIYSAICPPDGCVEMTPDGVPLHFDYGHLTLAGAKYIVGKLHDAFALPQ